MEPFDSAEAGSREPIPGGASHTQILEKSREIWVSPLPGSSCIPQGSARHLPVPKAVSSVGRGISSTARTHGSWKFQGSRSSGMATAASRQCWRDRAAAPAGSSGMMDGVKWSAGKGKRSTPGWREAPSRRDPMDHRECWQPHQPPHQGANGAAASHRPPVLPSPPAGKLRRNRSNFAAAAEPKAEVDFPEQGIPWAERAEGGSGI